MTRNEILNELRNLIAHYGYCENDVSLITEETNFKEDLGLDSLDSLELIIAVERDFNITLPEGNEDKIETIKILIDLIEKLV